MTDLEKNIEDAANKYSVNSGHFYNTRSGFIAGTYSSEAKEYWQQGMFSKEEAFNLASHAFNLGIQRGTLTEEFLNKIKRNEIKTV